jgi:hypothetical protein
VTSVVNNIPGATNVASPNCWSNAALQALISLPSVLDLNCTREAPTPYTLCTSSGARKAGALQSAP